MKRLLFCVLGSFMMAQAFAQLTINLSVPANTPISDSIFIAGTFNGWNAGSTTHRLTRQPNGTYSITLPQGSGTMLFKFTRGNWQKVESTANGQNVGNRSYTWISGPANLSLSVAGWLDLTGGGGSSSTANAQVSVLSNNFFLPQLNRSRRLWLYLPPDYASQPQKRYPVIYMQDGQNLFDQTTSFSGEWQVDETLTALHQNGDYGAIVVGIDNGGSQRLNEYSPWVNAQYGGGQGAAYVDFLLNTLKPYVDSAYRTLSGPSNTLVMGSSMGGLISQYAHLREPQVFGKAGIFSPAFWFSNNSWLQPRTSPYRPGNKLYLLTGGSEGSNPQVQVADVVRMRDSLQQASGYPAAALQYVLRPAGQHTESFWRAEFGAAYQWLTAQPTTAVEAPGRARPEVWPNPSTRLFHFSAALSGDSVEGVIYSVDGRKIKSVTLQANSSFQLEGVPAGLYLLVFDDAGQRYRISLQKQ